MHIVQECLILRDFRVIRVRQVCLDSSGLDNRTLTLASIEVVCAWRSLLDAVL